MTRQKHTSKSKRRAARNRASVQALSLGFTSNEKEPKCPECGAATRANDGEHAGIDKCEECDQFYCWWRYKLASGWRYATMVALNAK